MYICNLHCVAVSWPIARAQNPLTVVFIIITAAVYSAQ